MSVYMLFVNTTFVTLGLSVVLGSIFVFGSVLYDAYKLGCKKKRVAPGAIVMPHKDVPDGWYWALVNNGSPVDGITEEPVLIRGGTVRKMRSYNDQSGKSIWEIGANVLIVASLVKPYIDPKDWVDQVRTIQS